MVFKEIVFFTTLYKFPGRKMKCLKSTTNGFSFFFVIVVHFVEGGRCFMFVFLRQDHMYPGLALKHQQLRPASDF